ncbi:Anaphase-promoting complex subunit 11 [Cyphomyrmex costatus]|uniref:Anaphase-promoting complex subunit 11 n=1 Tax=Cyphomyrmex costatus TaxID=456900 RepID=A0A195CXJ8_9HYME|nr:Anaphase-promoting complex subunit 11 [Cyphomyrmex costatus]
MKVTIKSWTGVATWRWIANDDNCGICRMPFDASCPDCKIPGDDCPLGRIRDGARCCDIDRRVPVGRWTNATGRCRCPSPSPWAPSSIDARRMCARTSVRSFRCYHPSFLLLLIARCTRPFTGPVGAVLALFSYTLHHEVAAFAADQPHMPDVSPGVEVQGVTAAYPAGPQVSARSE